LASPAEQNSRSGSGVPAVLVTGGNGLVGRSLVRRLVAAGQQVRILSRNGSPTRHPRIAVHRGDLLRPEDVRAAIRGCTAVFHCAAEKHDPATMPAVNVTATQLLIDLARDQQLSFFCHLSSVGVIGKVATTLVDEATPCNPTNRYEETKLAAERLLLAGLDTGTVAILRPTNIFSADTLALLLERSARARLKMLLTGNENSHLVFVEDVAAAAVFCMHSGSSSRVATYIVSSDEEAGGTHLQVQASLAAMSHTAASPPAIAVPLWVSRWRGMLKGRRHNRGDVIYSGRRLREAGFEQPFGRLRGLRHALESLGDPPGER
jgi:nucleoside-diphosphate-sugar epimerase